MENWESVGNIVSKFSELYAIKKLAEKLIFEMRKMSRVGGEDGKYANISVGKSRENVRKYVFGRLFMYISVRIGFMLKS